MSTRVAADRRNQLVRILSAATFLIFFQAYMLAPLLPRLSGEFGISVQAMGLVVPALTEATVAASLAYRSRLTHIPPV